MKAVLYARVSSEKQAEKDLSISAQLKALRKYASDKGLEIVREFVDEAESARTANRPAFQEMIALAKQKTKLFDIILVWKLSRFARNREDSIVFKSLLRKKGIQVISINEKFDDSPAGALLEGLIEVIDEFYSTNLAQDTKRGMRENASRGFYNGGYPPIGYKIEKLKEGAAQRNVLRLDEEYAPIVRRIFDMTLRGVGAKEIANTLNREGIKTRQAKTWARNHVFYVLKNEIYTGTLVWGVSDKSQEPLRRENNHDPIISKEEFEKAQSFLSKRSPKNCRPRTLNSQYLLSGLLYCGKCNYAYQGCAAKSSRFHYYACHNVLAKGKTSCSAKLVNKERIETAIVNRLKSQVLTEENLTKLLTLTNLELAQSRTAEQNQIDIIDKEIAKNERKLDNLYRVLEDGKFDADDLAPRIKEIRKSVDELREQKQILSMKTHRQIEPMTKAQLRKYVDDLSQLLSEGTIFEQKGFVRSFINRITVNDNKVTVSYTYPAHKDLEEFGLRGVLGSAIKSSPGRI